MLFLLGVMFTILLIFLWLRAIKQAIEYIEALQSKGLAEIVWGHCVEFSPHLSDKEISLLMRNARFLGIREVSPLVNNHSGVINEKI